ncbi:MAG: hypothetical protein ISQ32_00185 [Rickettsiales bacterium]|nr:hypothetical protein [Rickettsiales bacterium]
MIRNKNYSTITKEASTFVSAIKSFFEDFDNIDKEYKYALNLNNKIPEEITSKLVNLYNSSTLREKYILALNAQHSKLNQIYSSYHNKNSEEAINAKKRLVTIRDQLKTLYTKDSKSNIIESTSDWIRRTQLNSQNTNQRSDIRMRTKGGVDEITNRIKNILSQAKRLNKDQVHDNDLGQIFANIQKKINERNKHILASGIFLGSVSAILTAAIEYENNTIGDEKFLENEIKQEETSEYVAESDVSSDAPASEPGSDMGGSEYENGELFIETTQVFQALQYAILIAIMVMIVMTLVYFATTITAQSERNRITNEEIKNLEAEKLDNKIARKEKKFTERAEFIAETDEIIKNLSK